MTPAAKVSAHGCESLKTGDGDSACADCHGSGIQVLHKQVTCPVCKGKREPRYHRGTWCAACGGVGTWRVFTGIRACECGVGRVLRR